jgi:release factor glutamine methyltransferase
MTASDSADVDAIVRRLRAAGCVFAEDEARLIVGEAVDHDELESFVARRVSGEPLEYVVGWAEFCGLRVAVAPGVFVPRTRTGVLVREAVRVAPHAPVVLDLCCGAGAIGAAVLARRPDATIHACDIDPVATDCARRTLAAVVNDRRAAGNGDEGAPVDDPSNAPHVYTGDLYAPLPSALRGTVDIIVANAPYVPTDEIWLMPHEAREHEALAALDGGEDGLELQRRVAHGAREWLAPRGRLLIETSRRQASATAGILESAGFSVSVARDGEVDGTVAVGVLR